MGSTLVELEYVSPMLEIRPSSPRVSHLSEQKDHVTYIVFAVFMEMSVHHFCCGQRIVDLSIDLQEAKSAVSSWVQWKYWAPFWFGIPPLSLLVPVAENISY